MKLGMNLSAVAVNLFSDPCSPACQSLSFISTSSAQLQLIPQPVFADEGNYVKLLLSYFARRSKLFYGFSSENNVFDSQA